MFIQKINKNNVLIFFFLLFIISLLISAADIAMPFLISCFFAYILNPFTKIIRKKYKLSQNLAAIVTISVLLSLLAIIISFAFPYCYQQTINLYHLLLKKNWNTTINQTLNFVGQYIPVVNKSEFIKEKIMLTLNSSMSFISNNIDYLVQSTTALFSTVLMVILIPFITYYLLSDYQYLNNYISRFITTEQKQKFSLWGEKIDILCKNFLIGQTSISLFWGLYYGLIYHFIGIKFAFAIGFISFIAAFIPYVGAIVTLVVSIIAIMIQFGEITIHFWLALGFYVLGHILDVCFVNNFFVGKKIGLHPLATIFSLLFSAKFLGIVGMFIALPMMVILKMIVEGIFIEEKNNK